jgi:very-short-patch-repair endonuclease
MIWQLRILFRNRSSRNTFGVREASSNPDSQCPKSGTLRPAVIAGQQWGVIGRQQLRWCGVGDRTIPRWQASGKLYDRHPGVYAYGHPSIPVEGELVAALLYAGDGAVLSHRTAAWWWGFVDELRRPIEVSTRSQVTSLPDVVVHQRRRFDRTRHRRFAITTPPQTFLDFAVTAELYEVRNALANADYRDLLDTQAVTAVLGQGRSGTVKLRRALERHEPRLAQTRSRTERLLVHLCETAGLPMPEVNVKLHGWTADFFWREHGLVVETDGHGNHHSPGQIDRDRRKDLTFRSHGLSVNRYSRQQVELDGATVIADLARTLAALAAASSSRTELSA